MLTRRELMERAEARLRARATEEGSAEASRCFLRAMLVGIDESAVVPEDLVARVSEFLKLDLGELTTTTPPRASTRPPPSSFPLQAAPGERPRRVLFLGRSDGGRMPMIEAVARATLADDADVRVASLTPAPYDPRALRVLRHAGYATDALQPRAVTVDDLSWADLVVTIGGEREAWDRFLPRSTPQQHESIDDPIALARALQGASDELEPFRSVLRLIERTVAVMRPPRSSRMPSAAPVRPSWSRAPVARPASDDDPPSPSSSRLRTR